jgi:hypothetical protein
MIAVQRDSRVRSPLRCSTARVQAAVCIRRHREEGGQGRVGEGTMDCVSPDVCYSRSLLSLIEEEERCAGQALSTRHAIEVFD